MTDHAEDEHSNFTIEITPDDCVKMREKYEQRIKIDPNFPRLKTDFFFQLRSHFESEIQRHSFIYIIPSCYDECNVNKLDKVLRELNYSFEMFTITCGRTKRTWNCVMLKAGNWPIFE